MKLIVMLIILFAGCLATTQAGVNHILSQYLKSNLLAALVSFIVGTIGIFIIVALLRIPIPESQMISKVPWWAWLGGLMGAFLVTATIYAVPKLGATTMFALFVAGQLIASVIFDHFGIIGYPHHPVSLIRILGIALIFIGVALVKYF